MWKKPKVEKINPNEIHFLPELTPKRDEMLLSLMEQALKDELPLYYAAIPLALCIHFDVEYRPDMHPLGKTAIKQASDEATQNIFQELLVYPKGLWFVVADDYIPLFAAIGGLPDYVPCYILGKPDNPHIKDVQGPIHQQDVAKVLGLQ